MTTNDHDSIRCLALGAFANAGAVALGLGGLVLWARFCENRRRTAPR
jgi:hypothetical protein